ncbi:J domain-containing protein required for chloroplast accumulation response 1 [Euphorbia lathyris]|uniref:J domain-containing protein required for chloroplast accumulation response 1 n=1 Tax=Euphorbia lathyris TaxID=212925 RepID=UPI0033142908
MGTCSQKESILLSYDPQRSVNEHPISPPDSPDIDFNDVFGGPPRRASTQEMRSSFGDALRGEDEIISRRHRWSGVGEKPVFGEESVNRRRYASNDFFGDIFGGSESLSSSPRKTDRDPFSSNPGSRVSSPARPLPPRVSEIFASSSLPAQLSLPAAKLIHGAEMPTSGSNIRNHLKNKDSISNSFTSQAPLSRFSSQVQEDSKNNVSSNTSSSQEESISLTKPEEINKDSILKKDSTDSQVPSVNHQFHFSIYKWASKGVPLSLSFKGGYSSKMKEKFKLERSLSASRRIACEGMAKESPTGTSHNINIDSGTFAATVSSDADSCKIEPDHIKVFERKSILHKSESEIPSNHQEIVKDKEEKGQISAEAPKSQTKTLRSLLSGNDKVISKQESEESSVKSTKKSAAVNDAREKVSKLDEERTILNSVEMDKANVQGTSRISQDSAAKPRAKGKIKEFVKMFDQETSEQPKFNETSQSLSSRWRERGKFRTRDDESVPTTKVNEDVQKTSTPATPIMVDAFPKLPEKRRSQVRTDSYKPTSTSSGLKDSSASSAASIPKGSEARDEHLRDSFHENIQIKELTQDEDELQQDGDSREEIRAIDAKVRKWSQGKQGNIRSLLSTLQYVLWSESGWKPVPLVDIIEGNAVKRSYQKALLSLHPDKLQQKGATSNQKYIAEQVFEILQEAWTHFSSLGPL